ncbi:N-acetylmuramoyl-L-alanine amidase [Streptomyces sp. KAI-26]|uniref:N-acetylmuramoyl-L-alanine amidase n=1 Tax=Streptomyces cavourensis TaxID=67258 RepID=A0ABY5F4A2_9ACTN|nr:MULTISPECIES: peptidoglycan recognition family protein [Streptomyces]NUV87155.1 N-acetylmuramoyl-L-alanine amidase [Streptomyces sp. KAI-26]NUW21586.1 N-acetylmuramoyl-L-alanine amidase [Streptomyces roseoviolaceus]UTR78499.1 N-acetylmuramoyl-L-alanine amidase [Streptomyces cavourensis]
MGNNGSTRASRKPSGRSSRKKSGGVSRRALLIGGGAVVAAGTAAVLAREEMKRAWWRIPGVEKPRKPGELDYAGATWIAASEANWRRADRPDDFRIDRVIIHVTQGSFDSAVRVFQDPSHRAATHYIVGQDGRVVQMIRELDVAYQAGNRSFNERAVGIEHEGFVDRPEDLTKEMYEASARLTASICARYDIPIDREHIIGHVEVPGTDHTDPGPHWDWDRYLKLVRRAATAPPTPSASASAKAE